ncbi:hypothetical protein H4N58_10120 [Mumia sp. ZJ1417]|uniref:hypothetical protein n=1 Tax=unclassified Mumia TaxID=2621872 RepID=UPI001420B5C9|nr:MULTISPECIES: hypothetical protein [unclassified Mumia]QMW68160.1 hypothetical protein H4N58_10120 [Mumia sp. ZJ1417]
MSTVPTVVVIVAAAWTAFSGVGVLTRRAFIVDNLATATCLSLYFVGAVTVVRAHAYGHVLFPLLTSYRLSLPTGSSRPRAERTRR